MQSWGTDTQETGRTCSFLHVDPILNSSSLKFEDTLHVQFLASKMFILDNSSQKIFF